MNIISRMMYKYEWIYRINRTDISIRPSHPRPRHLSYYYIRILFFFPPSTPAFLPRETRDFLVSMLRARADFITISLVWMCCYIMFFIKNQNNTSARVPNAFSSTRIKNNNNIIYRNKIYFGTPNVEKKINILGDTKTAGERLDIFFKLKITCADRNPTLFR